MSVEIVRNIVVLGPPLAGKSTIVRHLRASDPTLSVKELDEELIAENGGTWPADAETRTRLIPHIVRRILDMGSPVVFFTTYIDPDTLQAFRRKGFLVAQLSVPPETLRLRAERRRQETGETDPEPYIRQNISYQEEIRRQGLVDRVVDATASVGEVVSGLGIMPPASA